MYYTIHLIEIYPVDSIIQPLHNQGLMDNQFINMCKQECLECLEI